MAAFALQSQIWVVETDQVDYKPQNIYYVALYRESLSIPVLNYAEWIFCIGNTDPYSKIITFTFSFVYEYKGGYPHSVLSKVHAYRPQSLCFAP